MTFMEILFSIITVFVIFFIVKYLTWKITNEWGLPEWLQYKPWICDLCLTFWSLIFIYSTFWLSFNCLYIGVVGDSLAIMNALAMWIDQRNRTIYIDEEK